jgi:hypothetical protein
MTIITTIMASIHTSDHSPTSPTSIEDIVKLAFEEGHGYKPYEWQISNTSHILSCDNGAVLMVRSTGGGKSAVRNTLGLIREGVSLTIVPLLSLGADQTEKINVMAQTRGLSIESHHLDEIQNPNDDQSLISFLNSLHASSDACVFLFTSPQKITRSKAWQECLLGLAAKGLLSITVDECHLYVQFGLEFRSEFCQLREILFAPILSCDLNVPILFQTATATKECFDELQSITGVELKDNNLLWSSDPTSVARRSIFIDLVIQESPLRTIKAGMRHHLSLEDNRSKIILYTNSRKRAKHFHKQLSTFADEELLHGDLLLVHGVLFREQKFHHIRTFCGPDLIEENPKGGGKLYFRPRVLIATAGAAGAGVDPDCVHFCARDGFPPSISDQAQEMGRVGRDGHASPDRDVFRMIVSWKSFSALLFRIYIINRIEREARAAEATEENSDPLRRSTSNLEPNALSLEALQERQYENLLKVIEVLFCYPGCIHMKLERAFVNPFQERPEAPPSPCLNACFYCCKSPVFVELYQPVSRSGLTFVLVDIFIHTEVPPQGRGLHDGLVSLLASYKSNDSGKSFSSLVFHKDRKKQPPKEVKILLLRLFAAKILIPKVEGNLIYCKLNTTTEGAPFLLNDDAWRGVPTLD